LYQGWFIFYTARRNTLCANLDASIDHQSKDFKVIYISQTLPPQQSAWALFFSQLGTRGRRTFNEIVVRQRVKASLGRLSARGLRDIGLTSNDVTSIGHLPLPSSGALELAQTGKSRAGNW